jgi:hypothetical protein
LVSIGISPLNPSIILGTNIQFVATGYYSDGSAQNITSTATWTSSDTTVATLSATGYATSVGVGNTTIEAAVGTINNATVLTITPSGLATAYRPSTAVDTGDTVTSSPALAYDASISTYATVFSTYSNPLGGDLLREEGICTWSGFPTVILAAPSSLNILIATDFTGNSRGYVQVSINGSVVQSYYATTALVNIVYPLSAGTNISTYTVGIRSHCTDGGAIHTGGEIDANIYEIYIPH